MRELFARSLTVKLRKLTAELRSLDRGLKSNPPLDGAALREFRQALDNIRLTAWGVSELHNARQSQKDPQAVISFLTAERLRRFSQMARDLSDDLEQHGTSWPAQAVRDLESSLTLLGARLTIVDKSEPAGKGCG
jgi:hypothetical protein